MLDERAVDILQNTYWSPKGWRDEKIISPEDFAYAKSKNVMFDPISVSHDHAVENACKLIKKANKNEIVDAFIVSLGSRRLELRSALGSFAVGRHFQNHVSSKDVFCSHCRQLERGVIDLNVLNFERIKWGGVRHDNPAYISLDLTLLNFSNNLVPTFSDFEILRKILLTANTLGRSASLSDLEKALARVFASNSSERRTLIQILGYAGILKDPSKPDFRKKYVPYSLREEPSTHKNDWSYPVMWWKGEHGIDADAVDDWFPNIWQTSLH